VGISTRRKLRRFKGEPLFLGFTGLFLVLAIAVWVFFAFYFDDVFNNIASEKLISAVRSVSHGTYQLTLRRITYSHGVVVARGMEIMRVGYRAGETGMTVRRVSIDSVRLTGVSLWDVVFGRPLNFTGLHMNDPQVYTCWIGEAQAHLKLLAADTAQQPSSSTPIISLDSAIFADVRLFRSCTDGDVQAGTASAKSYGLRWDSKTRISPFTSKRLDLAIPRLDFPDSNVLHSWQIRNLIGRTEDSLLTIDTIGYNPTHGSEARRGEAAKPLHIGTSTDFQFLGIRAEGIDFAGLMAGKGVVVQSFAAHSWRVDHNSDKPKAKDTTAKKAFSQNDLAKLISFPITLGRLDLPQGNLRLSQSHGSLLLLEDLGLKASEFHFDPKVPSNEPLFSKQVEIDLPQFNYEKNGSLLELYGVHADTKDELLNAASVAYSKSGMEYRFVGPQAEGINFVELLEGRDIAIRTLEANSWSIAGASYKKRPQQSSDSKSFSQKDLAKSIPLPISVGRIHFPNGSIHIGGSSTLSATRAHGASVGAYDFALDPKSPSMRPLFSGQAVIDVPRFSYGKTGASLVLANLHGNLKDGLVTASSIAYPNGGTDYRLDGVRAERINFADLLNGRGISLAVFKTNSWSIDHQSVKGDTTVNTSQKSDPRKNIAQSISIPFRVGQIDLPHGTIKSVTVNADSGKTLSTFLTKDVSIKAFDFNLDPRKTQDQPALFSKQVLFSVPSVSWNESDGFYSFEMRNMQGNLRDSLVTIDTLGYIPKYGEDEFAARHQYSRGRTDFRCSSLRAEGVNFADLLMGGGVAIRILESQTWLIDYYKDRRKPVNPQPKEARLANDLIQSVKFPITIQTIVLDSGHIRFRERIPGSADAGVLTFENVNIIAHPFTTDRADSQFSKPTQFDLNGVFVGESHLVAKALYQLHDSTFNLSIVGKVGPFDAKRLNAFLVTNNREEITSGQLDTGIIKMDIIAGNATTTVTPEYHELSLKVLPPRLDDPPDLEEGVKSLITNALIIRRDNPDDKGETPVSATTTRTRAKIEELFQFIWLALKQSLGKLIGGF
jgi:hypothetical protein